MIHSTKESNSIIPKSWLVVSAILIFLGLGLSAYSTWHHVKVKTLGVTESACHINESINCDSAALSPYSEVFTVPLGIWGLAFFLNLGLLFLFLALRLGRSSEHISNIFVFTLFGFLASLTLSLISAFQLATLCLVCSSIHLVTLILFLSFIYVFYKKQVQIFLTFKSLFSGLTVFVLAFAAVFFVYDISGLNYRQIVERPSTEAPAQTTAVEPVLMKAQDIPIAKSPYSGYGEDYRKGSDEAKVAIVSFSDFQCPACRNMSMTLQEIEKEFGADVLVVFRNYPLPMHPFSHKIALMGRCAGQEGKFWEFHNLAFARQQQAAADSDVTWAKEVGLSEAQINSCRSNKSFEEKIKDDVALGDRLGVQATPTVYINGQQFVGRSIDDLKNEISRLLGKT